MHCISGTPRPKSGFIVRPDFGVFFAKYLYLSSYVNWCPMILILTEPSDTHSDFVIEKLKNRGADFLRFNPEDFPSRSSVSIGYAANGQMRSTLGWNGSSIDLNTIRSVWMRRPGLPVPDDRIQDETVREFVAAECQGYLRDVWNTLDAFWLPAPPAVLLRAGLKMSQLRIASDLEFELPPTLVTNSPDEFLDFYQQNNGKIISKLVGNSFQRAAGNTFVRYTEFVSHRNIGYASVVQHCPVILQAYVPKRLELRITVVGQQVFAAEIHSQHTHHTRYDWRRYDYDQTPHFEHELPAEIASQCVRLVERLNLQYGAIDMILTPDGRYVFIEINPNGQYLWIEQKTGLPISDAICDLLISGSKEN